MDYFQKTVFLFYYKGRVTIVNNQQHFFQIFGMIQKRQKAKMSDYEIIRDLGFGSYGKVQLIRRKQDKKMYALKSVPLANAKQKEKDSALNEIRILASINMPYVISYKTSFYTPESQSLCIVMQYADGGDLQAKINKRMQIFETIGFDQKFIWRTAFHILKGLKCLHQNNIIHRDLKSANIFFANGVAKIGDLNISKITDNGFAATQTGTPYYTAPQIWKGQKYDNKCDIWALGCIVYQLCTLLPPFRAQDFPGLFQTITNGQYEDIASSYSKQLKTFIEQCLTISVQKRSSATTLLQKGWFMQYQWTEKQSEENNAVNIIQPIECPKLLNSLNQKLPRSKFEEAKKTVCFAIKDPESSVSFKIKKVIRSQKVITIDEQSKSMKQIKATVNQSIRSTKKLPPLEKQPVLKKIEAQEKKRIQCRSMKNILEKENKKLTIK